MPKPKEKPSSSLREPKPKSKRFGLKVPDIRPPHEAFIVPETHDDSPVEQDQAAPRHGAALQGGAVLSTGAAPTDGAAPVQTGVPNGLTRSIGEAAPLQGAAPPRGAAGRLDVVEWVDGFLMLPNWLRSRLLPKIKNPVDRMVYIELYAWTHGYLGTNPRRLSQRALAKALAMKGETIADSVSRLEELGLVVKGDTVQSGPVAGRGTLFDVRIPELVGAPQGAQAAPHGGAAPPRGAARAAGHMKENPKKDMKEPAAVAPADISPTLRTEAENYRSRFPNATDDVVRARLTEFMKDQHWRVDEAKIDEAIRSSGG